MTVMGDAFMEELSDRGSIPLRSIRRPLKYGLFKPYFEGFFSWHHKNSFFITYYLLENGIWLSIIL